WAASATAAIRADADRATTGTPARLMAATAARGGMRGRRAIRQALPASARRRRARPPLRHHPSRTTTALSRRPSRATRPRRRRPPTPPRGGRAGTATTDPAPPPEFVPGPPRAIVA